MLTYTTYRKNCCTLQETIWKKNHKNWLKNKKVIQSQKMIKILSLKIQQGAGIFKKPQNNCLKNKKVI